MKIYVQEPTTSGRRGIFRAEVCAEDGHGDYGTGFYFGWGYTPSGAEEAAGQIGQLYMEGDIESEAEEDRICDALNDFLDGVISNRLMPRIRWSC